MIIYQDEVIAVIALLVIAAILFASVRSHNKSRKLLNNVGPQLKQVTVLEWEELGRILTMLSDLGAKQAFIPQAEWDVVRGRIESEMTLERDALLEVAIRTQLGKVNA